MTKANLMKLTGYFLFLVFFISLFFSFRAISSFALAGLLIWSLAGGHLKFKWNTGLIFVLTLAIYFFLGLVHGDHVLLRGGLLLTGLTTWLTLYSKKLNWDIIFLLLVASLLMALLYSFIFNTVEFSRSGDKSLFFYHSLVNPAGQHAVYFSIYVLAAIIYLFVSLRKNNLYFGRSVYVVVIIFLSISLVLLSSKLVIGFFLFYLILQFFQQGIKKRNAGLSSVLLVFSFVASGLVLITKNPVGDRFREIFKGDASILTREKYDPGDYLDPVEFRLLQWKLVREILNEKNSWLKGTGANAQNYLDEKYRERNIYTGDPFRRDRGFLGYNAHNQLLEALLHYGIAGAIVLIAILAIVLNMAWKMRRTSLALIFILLILYALTESVFETQYGIILFSFLPLFLYSREQTF